MIIFNLDGTLADCEHRRHFVDPLKDHPDYYRPPCKSCNDGSHHKIDVQLHKETGERWKPDWKAFDEACDKDKPILPVIEIMDNFFRSEMDFQIWSERCESVREKTLDWLIKNISCLKVYHKYGELNPILKMRPIGDTTPDDVLKERWYDLHNVQNPRKNIEFVFEDSPKVIRMWQRRGIFVFNCCQHGEEF